MKKRTGYIFKRGQVYWLRYTVNGKRIPQSLETTRKDEAESRAAKILEPIRATDEVKTIARVHERLKDAEAIAADLSPVTIEDAWKVYREQDGAKNPGDALLNKYQSYWNEFSAHCVKQGATTLRQITPEMVGAFMKSIGGNAAGTQKKKRTFLWSFFDVMRDPARLTGNPFDKAKKKRITGAPNSRRPMTIDQLKAAIESAEGELKTIFIIGTFTGLRLGDCCRLRWDEVDLHRRIIQTMPSKTSRIRKLVKIGVPEYLAQHLQSLKVRTGAIAPAMAKMYAEDTPKLSRMIQAHLQSCGIKTVMEGTGDDTGKRAVPIFGFHSLRHSYITLQAESGTPQAILQKMVGHGNPVMTQLYTHVTDDAAIRAAKAMPLLGAPEVGVGVNDALQAALEAAKGITSKNWKSQRKIIMELLVEAAKGAA